MSSNVSQHALLGQRLGLPQAVRPATQTRIHNVAATNGSSRLPASSPLGSLFDGSNNGANNQVTNLDLNSYNSGFEPNRFTVLGTGFSPGATSTARPHHLSSGGNPAPSPREIFQSNTRLSLGPTLSTNHINSGNSTSRPLPQVNDQEEPTRRVETFNQYAGPTRLWTDFPNVSKIAQAVKRQPSHGGPSPRTVPVPSGPPNQGHISSTSVPQLILNQVPNGAAGRARHTAPSQDGRLRYNNSPVSSTLPRITSSKPTPKTTRKTTREPPTQRVVTGQTPPTAHTPAAQGHVVTPRMTLPAMTAAPSDVRRGSIWRAPSLASIPTALPAAQPSHAPPAVVQPLPALPTSARPTLAPPNLYHAPAPRAAIPAPAHPAARPASRAAPDPAVNPAGPRSDPAFEAPTVQSARAPSIIVQRSAAPPTGAHPSPVPSVAWPPPVQSPAPRSAPETTGTVNASPHTTAPPPSSTVMHSYPRYRQHAVLRWMSRRLRHAQGSSAELTLNISDYTPDPNKIYTPHELSRMALARAAAFPNYAPASPPVAHIDPKLLTLRPMPPPPLPKATCAHVSWREKPKHPVARQPAPSEKPVAPQPEPPSEPVASHPATLCEPAASQPTKPSGTVAVGTMYIQRTSTGGGQRTYQPSPTPCVQPANYPNAQVPRAVSPAPPPPAPPPPTAPPPPLHRTMSEGSMVSQASTQRVVPTNDKSFSAAAWIGGNTVTHAPPVYRTQSLHGYPSAGFKTATTSSVPRSSALAYNPPIPPNATLGHKRNAEYIDDDDEIQEIPPPQHAKRAKRQ